MALSRQCIVGITLTNFVQRLTTHGVHTPGLGVVGTGRPFCRVYNVVNNLSRNWFVQKPSNTFSRFCETCKIHTALLLFKSKFPAANNQEWQDHQIGQN